MLFHLLGRHQFLKYSACSTHNVSCIYQVQSDGRRGKMFSLLCQVGYSVAQATSVKLMSIYNELKKLNMLGVVFDITVDCHKVL